MSSELSLTERAQGGDRAAIAQLLQRSEPDLRRFASRVCRSAADADDAVQHAMLTVTVRLDTFRGLARLSTWFFAVIRNECRKYERIARRWVLGDVDHAHSSIVSPEHAAERGQELDQLVNAIRLLSPDYREVFVLRELDELTTEACAERLGISAANVKVRLHRARALLRAALLD